MLSLRTLPALCAAPLLLVGCFQARIYEDAPPADRDLGISFDAALPDGGRDAGGPIVSDGGPTRVDAGTSVCDTGERLDPYDGPICGDDTLACLEECERSPDPGFCQDDCFMADPVCMQCINGTIIACATNAGCQMAWDVFACCTERRCPGLTGTDRFECVDQCEGEFSGFAECVNEEAIERCEPLIYECLGG